MSKRRGLQGLPGVLPFEYTHLTLDFEQDVMDSTHRVVQGGKIWFDPEDCVVKKKKKGSSSIAAEPSPWHWQADGEVVKDIEAQVGKAQIVLTDVKEKRYALEGQVDEAKQECNMLELKNILLTEELARVQMENESMEEALECAQIQAKNLMWRLSFQEKAERIPASSAAGLTSGLPGKGGGGGQAGGGKG